ncbi:hypothetical protein NDU88_001342 [Pleurodeles waltl]|uniref:Uncharacterized protein n=1 Tax=Pleurodeles waltl TaxID=8319 RepID=A0AAV7KRU4_PLEWA|nr:hypothetical protein NDU88_001342 [Pleurodeles waltl]
MAPAAGGIGDVSGLGYLPGPRDECNHIAIFPLSLFKGRDGPVERSSDPACEDLGPLVPGAGILLTTSAAVMRERYSALRWRGSDQYLCPASPSAQGSTAGPVSPAQPLAFTAARHPACPIFMPARWAGLCSVFCQSRRAPPGIPISPVHFSTAVPGTTKVAALLLSALALVCHFARYVRGQHDQLFKAPATPGAPIQGLYIIRGGLWGHRVNIECPKVTHCLQDARGWWFSCDSSDGARPTPLPLGHAPSSFSSFAPAQGYFSYVSPSLRY